MPFLLSALVYLSRNKKMLVVVGYFFLDIFRENEKEPKKAASAFTQVLSKPVYKIIE